MGGVLDPAVVALDEVTGLSRDERRAVVDLLAQWARQGGVRGPVHAAVLDRLGWRDFGWPEFDRWHEFFARRGAFPPLWHGLAHPPSSRAPSAARRAYQEQKLYLLVDWLVGLAASRVENRTALARYARRRCPAEVVRQGGGAPCPVCDPLDRRRVRYDQRNIPPFHPGCRCLVLAAARDVARFRTRPARGRRSEPQPGSSYFTANGLTGDPTAPVMGIGGATKRNS